MQATKLLSMKEIQTNLLDAGFVAVPKILLDEFGCAKKAHFLSYLMSSWIFYTDGGKDKNGTFYACAKHTEKNTFCSESTQKNYLKELKAKGWITVKIIDQKRHIGFTQEFIAKFSVFFGSMGAKFVSSNSQNLPAQGAKNNPSSRQILPPNKNNINNKEKNNNANAQKNARAENFSEEKNAAVTAPSELSKKFAAKKVFNSDAVAEALPLAFAAFGKWLEQQGKQAPLDNHTQTEAMAGVLEFLEQRLRAKDSAAGLSQNVTAQRLVAALELSLNVLLWAKADEKGNRKISLGQKENKDVDYFLSLNHISAFFNQISGFNALVKKIYDRQQMIAKKEQQRAQQPAPVAKPKPTATRPVEVVEQQPAKLVEKPTPTEQPAPVELVEQPAPATVAEVLAKYEADLDSERAQIAANIESLGIDLTLDDEVSLVNNATALSRICTVGEFLQYVQTKGVLEQTTNTLKYKGSKSSNFMEFRIILKNVSKYGKFR